MPRTVAAQVQSNSICDYTFKSHSDVKLLDSGLEGAWRSHLIGWCRVLTLLLHEGQDAVVLQRGNVGHEALATGLILQSKQSFGLAYRPQVACTT